MDNKNLKNKNYNKLVINFIKNIKTKMIEFDYTLSEFAKKIAVSKNTLKSWLSLKSLPRKTKIIAIADAFECSVESLLND